MNKRDPYKRIRPLMAYYKKYGTIENIKQDEEFENNGENVKIGWLVTNLRQDKKKGLLSGNLIEMLDNMDINWDGQDFFKYYKKVLIKWYRQHKTLSNLNQYSKIEYEGSVVDIGEILKNLRKYKKSNLLTDSQVAFLDNLEIVWAPKDKEVAYDMLVEYKKIHGTIANIRIEETFIFGDKVCNVGKQINHLRTRYNKGLLSVDEIEFFEDLGMVWNKKPRKNDEINIQR